MIANPTDCKIGWTIQSICYIKFICHLQKIVLLVLVLQSKQMVALRPPPVADITSNRKHIYVQRIATIFQTGEHGSPLQTMHNFHHIKTILLNIKFHQGGRPMNAPTFKQQLLYKQKSHQSFFGHLMRFLYYTIFSNW